MSGETDLEVVKLHEDPLVSAILNVANQLARVAYACECIDERLESVASDLEIMNAAPEQT